MEQAMKRKFYLFFPIILLAVLIQGCQKKPPVTTEKEKTVKAGTVNLAIWCAAEDEELISQIINGFKAEYSSQDFLCFRCCRETYLNLFKTNFYKHLKKSNFLFKTHRLN